MTDGELERILDGGNSALIAVLSQLLPEGTDKNYKQPVRKAGGPAQI
jgi:hypothetical protein